MKQFVTRESKLLSSHEIKSWEDFVVDKVVTSLENWERKFEFDITVKNNLENIKVSVIAFFSWNWRTKFKYNFLRSTPVKTTDKKRYEDIIITFLRVREFSDLYWMSWYTYHYWNIDESNYSIEIKNLFTISWLKKKRAREDFLMEYRNTIPMSLIYEWEVLWWYDDVISKNWYFFTAKWYEDFKFLRNNNLLKPEIVDVWGWSWESMLILGRSDFVKSVTIHDQSIWAMIKWMRKSKDINNKIHMYWWSPRDVNIYKNPTPLWRTFHCGRLIANIFDEEFKKWFMEWICSCLHDNDTVIMDFFTAHERPKELSRIEKIKALFNKDIITTFDKKLEDYNLWYSMTKEHYDSIAEERVLLKKLVDFWLHERDLKKDWSDKKLWRCISFSYDEEKWMVRSFMTLARDAFVWKNHSPRCESKHPSSRYLHKKWTQETLVESKRFKVDWEYDVRQKREIPWIDEITEYFKWTWLTIERVKKWKLISQLILRKSK